MQRKLVALLGQLGHDNQNVRANAGAAADKLLKAHNVTWEQAVCGRAHPAPETPRDPVEQYWGCARDLLEEADVAWTDWEVEFLKSLGKRSRELSEKQAEVMRRLWRKGGLRG